MEKLEQEVNELGLSTQFEHGNSMFATLNPESQEDKVAVFNAIQDTDFALNDMDGKIIEMSNFIAHTCNVANMNTGEMEEATRCIILDKDGKSYSTISPSFKNAMSNIFNIFGLPNTWEKPLKIKVLKKKGKGAFSFLTASVVTK